MNINALLVQAKAKERRWAEMAKYGWRKDRNNVRRKTPDIVQYGYDTISDRMLQKHVANANADPHSWHVDCSTTNYRVSSKQAGQQT